MASENLGILFGIVVRERRNAAELTQEELAEAACIHPTYLSLVERGVRNPTLDVSCRIATALGCGLAELIDQAEQLRATGKQAAKRKKPSLKKKGPGAE